MDKKPSLAIYELAHRARVVLSDFETRNKVCDCVRNTLGNRWSKYRAEVEAHDNLIRTMVEATKATYRGEHVEIPAGPTGSRPEAFNRLDGWPFPVEHGIEESPGCLLHLAALNDYAFEHSKGFLKTGVEFEPLLPFGEGGEQMTGPWFWYGIVWIEAVGKLTSEHFEQFTLVIESAIAILQGANEPDTDLGRPEGDGKRLTPAAEVAKLAKKVAILERQNKTKQTSQEKRREQRLKFIRARFDKKTWQEIATDWRANPPHEWKAENLADAMRLLWERHGEK